MQKSKSNSRAAMVTFFVFLSVIGSSLPATARDFQEGKDYFLLEKQRPELSDVVLEFFTYDCGACYRAESVIQSIEEALPAGKRLDRSPVIFGKTNYKVKAYAWFLYQELRLKPEVHQYIYDISHVPMAHEWDHNQLKYMENLETFFTTVYGGVVSSEQYNDALKNIDRKKMIEKSESLAKEFRIAGTPTIIVYGKYRIEGFRFNPGGKLYLQELLEYLTEKHLVER